MDDSLVSVIDGIDYTLKSKQLRRYRLAICTLTNTNHSNDLTFREMFTVAKDQLGGPQLAACFSYHVLLRSNWGYVKDNLKQYVTSICCQSEHYLDRCYPDVDLCLTVASYFDIMSDREYSSVRSSLADLHLQGCNVEKVNREELVFTLFRNKIISPGNVANIVSKYRYSNWFNNYLKKYKSLFGEEIQCTLCTTCTEASIVTNDHVTSGHVTNGHVTSGHVTSGHVTNGHNVIADRPTGTSPSNVPPYKTANTPVITSNDLYQPDTIPKKSSTAPVTEDKPHRQDINLIVDRVPRLPHLMKGLQSMQDRWELLVYALSVPSPEKSTSNLLNLSRVLEKWLSMKGREATILSLVEVLKNTLNEGAACDALFEVLEEEFEEYMNY